jgi:hypothetical protein
VHAGWIPAEDRGSEGDVMTIDRRLLSRPNPTRRALESVADCGRTPRARRPTADAKLRPSRRADYLR